MRVIALDCEMVASGNRSLLAKVSVVDEYCDVLLNCYVKPTAIVTDYRTGLHGIDKHDLETGRPFDSVRGEVANLLSGKILVGHSLHFDLQALNLSHPENDTRDFAKNPRFMKNGQPRALKDLAREFLQKSIQVNLHDSLEDARTCMQLYKRVASQW
ncbi:apoptosis-enhancing nuclease-like [Danaus plexippus]|nr:apoptosis-enhancing nuclease-like [Danaus plexippus]